MRSGIAGTFSTLAWLFAGCTNFGGEECADACSSNLYTLSFLDRAENRLDTLGLDSLRLEVTVKTQPKAGASTSMDCDICQARFTNPHLTSDQGMAGIAGDTIPPSTDLFDPAVAPKLGNPGNFSFYFFKKVRLKAGKNIFVFKADQDKKLISATGSIWVPDSLGF